MARQSDGTIERDWQLCQDVEIARMRRLVATYKEGLHAAEDKIRELQAELENYRALEARHVIGNMEIRA